MMEKIVGEKLIEAIRANVCDTCAWIKKVEPIWREGSLEGTDKLRGIVFTLDDPVETTIHLTVYNDELKISLSQLESVKQQQVYLSNL